MAVDLAELSSIASTLDQLARRLAGMAESAALEKEEDVSSELFAVERSLTGAERRVVRLLSRSSR
jgi:hypothetical protein